VKRLSLPSVDELEPLLYEEVGSVNPAVSIEACRDGCIEAAAAVDAVTFELLEAGKD
jgi:hypothetical protein